MELNVELSLNTIQKEKRMLKKKNLNLIIMIMALSLIMGACQPAAQAPAAKEPVSAEEVQAQEAAAEEPAAAESAEKEVVKFADTQWQTLWINNAIAMYITEHGYGYPVESIEMTTPVYQQAIVDGDVDVMMENWTSNIQDWWDAETAAGTVIDLGNTFDKSTQGWYVPRYVIEGDAERGIEPMAPDLKSVFDLAQYKEVFADPENPDKGLLVNCITGWDCANVNRVKLYAYGLADDYNLMEPGASAALDAAIAGAYKKGDAVLSYYWEPTWLLGMYDMIQLEEPLYTAECWDANRYAKEGNIELDEVTADAGCGYETIGIPKSVTASLVDRAPELVSFLEKMNVGTDELNKTAAFMESEGASAEEAAVWYLNTYPDKWQSWVNDDAKANIEAALAE
jgi:glycine betaine/proline transport system substrate-binding protein